VVQYPSMSAKCLNNAVINFFTLRIYIYIYIYSIMKIKGEARYHFFKKKKKKLKEIQFVREDVWGMNNAFFFLKKNGSEIFFFQLNLLN
jgi:hypothetical protein